MDYGAMSKARRTRSSKNRGPAPASCGWHVLIETPLCHHALSHSRARWSCQKVLCCLYVGTRYSQSTEQSRVQDKNKCAASNLKKIRHSRYRNRCRCQSTTATLARAEIQILPADNRSAAWRSLELTLKRQFEHYQEIVATNTGIRHIESSSRRNHTQSRQ